MNYIIGFDGGGSKTRCVLSDHKGNILADCIGGPSNHQTIGIKKTQEVIKELYDQVLKISSKTTEDIKFIFLGLAGADLESDFALLNDMCKRLFTTPYEVVNDAWIIMRSGTKEPYGAVSIYGTGANAGAIDRDGNMTILRALSYDLGGGGGGGEIATDALHFAFRSNERTYEKTALEDEIPKLFNLTDIESLLNKLYPTMQLSRLELNLIPPLVFKLASKGDLVCQEILETKGKTQGRMLNGVLTQNDMIGKEFPVVIGGSIYKGESPIFLDAFKTTVLESSPQAFFKSPELQPVAGAVLFGYDRLNIKVDDEIILNLKNFLRI